MKNVMRLSGGLIAVCLLLFSAAVAHAAGDEIASRTADVEGLKVHYLTAGHGPAVILLHGYTQTSRMWRPLIPSLAEKFTVIAPDLPGIGDSEIPKDGLDMKTIGDPHSCGSEVAGRAESESGWARHRTDGGVRLRRAISRRSGKAGVDGRVSARRRGMGSRVQQSEHLAFPF